MNIVVTGSDGFIGSHLCSFFRSSSDYTVSEWDVKRQKDIFSQDIRKAIEWADVVYHLAGFISVEDSWLNPPLTYDININGLAHVLHDCYVFNKKLIFVSSASVKDPASSPYAYSKYIGEELLIRFKKVIPIVVLRPFNVYGTNMNPQAGSVFYRYVHDNEIVVYGDGEQTRDFISIDDVVSIMVSAIGKKWDGKTVEVGTGVETTVRFLAENFSKYRNVSIAQLPERKEIKHSVANTTVLRSLYKKPFKTNIEEDIRKLCLLQ